MIQKIEAVPAVQGQRNHIRADTLMHSLQDDSLFVRTTIPNGHCATCEMQQKQTPVIIADGDLVRVSRIHREAAVHICVVAIRHSDTLLNECARIAQIIERHEGLASHAHRVVVEGIGAQARDFVVEHPTDALHCSVHPRIPYANGPILASRDQPHRMIQHTRHRVLMSLERTKRHLHRSLYRSMLLSGVMLFADAILS